MRRSPFAALGIGLAALCLALTGCASPAPAETPAASAPAEPTPTPTVEPIVIVYLNRLSDLLFVLARHVNASPDLGGKGDIKWVPGASR